MSGVPTTQVARRTSAWSVPLLKALRSTTGLAGDNIFRGLTLLAALLILAVVIGILSALLNESRLSMAAFGWSFVVGQDWDPVAKVFGALPFIYGTVVTSLIALALATPFGIAVAVFLTELAPRGSRRALSFGAELLAAIPSVVYGLWGIFVLAPFLQSVIEPGLGHFAFLPIFAGPPYGVGLLAGGTIVAIMIVPTIIAIARDVMTAVPVAQREAAYALGATQWEVISSAVIPYAASGIIGAVMLALGRAVGETMAVTMVIGNNPQIVGSLFALGNSMASLLANEFTEAAYPLYVSALIEIGLVLFGVTVLLNILARLLVWRVTRQVGG